MESFSSAALRSLYRAVSEEATDAPNSRSLPSGLSVHHYDGDTVAMPKIHTPFAYIVLAGRLTLHRHDGVRHVDPGHVVVSEFDTPANGYVSGQPLVTLLIQFTIDEIAAVLMEFDEGLPASSAEAKSGSDDQIDEHLLESVGRLLALRDEPSESSFMARHLKREIIYRLVSGSAGRGIVSAVTNIQDAAEMYYVNAWIKRNFKTAFTVETLARQTDMSPSAFHRKFKNAVQMGPLQCQKQLRLTEARRLLLDGTGSVADVATQVGYDSVSQFSREYRREFGDPPRRDIARLQEQLRKLAQEPGS